MINLPKSYVAGVGFKLVTPGSAVRHTTDCAMESGSKLSDATSQIISNKNNLLHCTFFIVTTIYRDTGELLIRTAFLAQLFKTNDVLVNVSFKL